MESVLSIAAKMMVAAAIILVGAPAVADHAPRMDYSLLLAMCDTAAAKSSAADNAFATARASMPARLDTDEAALALRGVGALAGVSARLHTRTAYCSDLLLLVYDRDGQEDRAHIVRHIQQTSRSSERAARGFARIAAACVALAGSRSPQTEREYRLTRWWFISARSASFAGRVLPDPDNYQ